MKAALFVALAVAQAGSLRTTLELGEGAPRVVSAAADAARPGVAGPGPVEVVDASGRVLTTVALPPLATHRSVVVPEGGGFAIEHPATRLRLRLPWPEGAAGLRMHGVPLALPAPALPPPAGAVEEVRVWGPSARRLDLLFLSEGYAAGERTKFDADVDAVVAHLQEVEPWSVYLDLLNVWKLWVPSEDSGVDQENVGLERTTAFGCGYGCDLVGDTAARLICCDEAAVTDTVDALAPFADGLMLLVNETRYGGSGGLVYSTSYTGDRLATQVAAHELGHTLLALWDEYHYGVAQPEGEAYTSPNCAPHGGELPWEAWIEGAPVDWRAWDTIQDGKVRAPRRFADVDCDGREGATAPDAICAYPGCSFTDWVRPTPSACMMYSLQDRYCPVCREAIVEALWREVGGPLTEASPDPDRPVRLDEGESATLSVTVDVPAGDAEVVWTVGDRVLGTGTELTLAAADGVCGEVVATVRDPTAWVRDDADGVLTGTVSWDVRAPRCCGCTTTDAAAAPWVLVGFAGVLGMLRRRRT